MATASSSTAPVVTPTSVGDVFNTGAGKGQANEGVSLTAFLASLSSGLVVFGIQFVLFLFLKDKFNRIYLPRCFLVPERERTRSPEPGFWRWILPVFGTSNTDYIQKCGLDAYFFLRYLRTLIKIFLPLAFIILPILLPVNLVRGKGSHFAEGIYANSSTWNNVTGLDQLSWTNVPPTKNNRFWAQLVLAVGIVVYTCFVFFDELRGYIRLRQAYLTSPQHRLRASATTVLVTAIPQKWCTQEALEGLYDVFPGGIRNIFINRNYDDLSDKVNIRNSYAKALEAAETKLVRDAKKAHKKQLGKEANGDDNFWHRYLGCLISKREEKKEQLQKKQEKQKILQQRKAAIDQGDGIGDEDGGISVGDPHQVHHTMDDALRDATNDRTEDQSVQNSRRKINLPFPKFEEVGHGIDNISKNVFRQVRHVGKGINSRLATQGDLPPGGHQEGTPQNGEVELSRNSSHEIMPSDYQVGSSQGDGGKSPRASSRESPTPLPGMEQSMPGVMDPSFDSQADGEVDRAGLPQDDFRTFQAADPSKPKTKFWTHNKRKRTFDIPSPMPHGQEEDEFPLSSPSPIIPGANPQATVNGPESQGLPKTQQAGKKKGWNLFFKKHEDDSTKKENYPTAYNEGHKAENESQPVWKTYLEKKDRDSMRLPLFGLQWLPSLPLVGKKKDTIYYCREQVARLNVEIEQDQSEPEKFPLMNSAFIQFNHQVAAHMACQAVSHHVPNQMAPRLVEIAPGDIIWNNMSIKWWESYIRTGAVLVSFVGILIGWAFPVTATGLISQVGYLTSISWLQWLDKIPTWILGAIQGILPQALLSLLLLLLPIILRFLAQTQGVHTGMAVELAVQNYYFFFLFVQVFLVVSISSGITTVIKEISASPQSIASVLASNLPKASNYFFSYILLQALSVSAGALLQVGKLFSWFIWGPLTDNTARQKWRRMTKLPTMQWGTFFPFYTNLAAIGLIYSVISPLILVFLTISFSLFWVAYRYNTLYVTQFRYDTGGLLYPQAINQLFTGLYFMEVCLIGLFILAREADAKGNAVGAPCKIQAIIMFIVFLLTALFQWLMNSAFGPLFRYLPITLEDEAVIRDEEFARAQEKNWRLGCDPEDEDVHDALEARERQSTEDNTEAENIEMEDVSDSNRHGKLDPRNLGKIVPDVVSNLVPGRVSWASRSQKRRSNKWADDSRKPGTPQKMAQRRHTTDLESQRSFKNPVGEALFSGLNDQLEDLTPDERDVLVKQAFKHEALRAKRPCIWIPRDRLGVSDDEIRQTQRFSDNIWISNQHCALDSKARVVYMRNPPDLSEVDLVEL